MDVLTALFNKSIPYKLTPYIERNAYRERFRYRSRYILKSTGVYGFNNNIKLAEPV